MSQDRTLRKEDPSRAPHDDEAPMRELRTRKRKGDADPFYIDQKVIPEGMTYEWKRKSTFGQEDVSHQLHMAENGWEPVMADRHPAYMPKGHQGAIERGDMVLMERPVELTREARTEERRDAVAAIHSGLAQFSETPENTLPRQGAKVKRSFASRDIPEE